MSHKSKRRAKEDAPPPRAEDGEIVDVDMDVDGAATVDQPVANIAAGADNASGAPAVEPAAPSDATLSDDDEIDWALVPADERMSSGFYKRIVVKLYNYREWALAHLDLTKYKFAPFRGNKILVPASLPDSALPSELSSKELSFLLIGEVGDPSFGPTGVKPEIGKFKKEIVDGMNIRAGLKLRAPRDWNTEALEGSDVFEDQMGTLQEAVLLAEGGGDVGRMALARSRSQDATHDIVHACTKSDRMLHSFDRVQVYTDLLYRKARIFLEPTSVYILTSFQDPNASTYLPLNVQRSPAKRKELGEPAPPAEAPLPDLASFTDPKAGDFYDPRLYPNYAGNKLMKLYSSKLVQLDIRDWNDDLLLPWQWPSYLREGALVLVQARLKVWLVDGVEEKGGFPAKKPAHIYQVIADSIRVMGKAPEPLDLQHTVNPAPLPAAPVAGESAGAGSSTTPAEPATPARPVTPPSERVRSAFASISFGSPSKKVKLEKK